MTQEESGHSDSTSIRISRETWKKLNERKDEPGKTWDDVMIELLEETEGKSRPTTTAD